jgi:uncharacterized protein
MTVILSGSAAEVLGSGENPINSTGSTQPARVSPEDDIRALIEQIAQSLVDFSEKVSVQAVAGEQAVVLELRVAPEDVGKVIGKQGRTARSMRTILMAVGMKLKKRFTLEILE